MIDEATLSNSAVELVKKSAIILPDDVTAALKKAQSGETEEIPKYIMGKIIENTELAVKNRAPICQDTGVPIFFVKIGRDALEDNIKIIKNLDKILADAVKIATMETPLRKNVVHPLTRKNTGTNTGLGFPYVNYEFVNGNFIEITVHPKGGGTENMSFLTMHTPTLDLEQDIVDYVTKTVKFVRGKACAPNIIGIGLGGSSDIAMKLAKKASIRGVGTQNPDTDVAKLEKKILAAVNETGVGPLGFGGKTTALAVNIEFTGVHTSVYPIGINFLCWAARQATMRIEDGEIKFI